MSLATTLSVSTPSDLEVVVERMFDAPADLVFDCYTQPDLVRRWMTARRGGGFRPAISIRAPAEPIAMSGRARMARAWG